MKHQTLRPGDVLTLFSDGVTEENNPAGEEFGEKRLADVLVENARRRRGGPGRTRSAATVLTWAAGGAPADDVTGRRGAAGLLIPRRVSFADFRPAPWLRGAHAQTIVRALLPRRRP